MQGIVMLFYNIGNETAFVVVVTFCHVSIYGWLSEACFQQLSLDVGICKL